MGDRDGLFKMLGWGAFAFAGSAFFLPLINSDLYWHLSAGRFIFAHLAVPRHDFLSWTVQGQPWYDFEWLTQVIYYAFFLAGGFKALLVLKGVILLAVLFVFKKLLDLHGHGRAAFLALPFFSAAIMPGSDLRPDNFSLLFFSLVLYALEAARLAGGIRAGGSAPLKAFLFFVLWANLHAGFAYGLALIGLYAAGTLLEAELPFIYGARPPVRPVQSLRLLAVFFAGFAATFVNPYGWKLYAVLAQHQRYMDVLQSVIREWSGFDVTNLYQAPYAFSLLLVFGLALYFLIRTKRVVYEHFACLVFFAWSSVNHIRHIPFFVITGLTFSAALPFVKPQTRALKAAAAGLAALFSALLFWYYSGFIWPMYTGGAVNFDCRSEDMIGFLRQNKAGLSKLKMLNPWDWGGYLGWELAPDYKVFQDGRYLFHDKLDEMAHVTGSRDKWEHLVEKYNFALVLIRTGGASVRVTQKLENGGTYAVWRPVYLDYLPPKNWAVVHWNDKITALVRRTSVSAAWLQENEYVHLRPGDASNIEVPVLEGDVSLGAVKKELYRYRDSHSSFGASGAGTDLLALYRRLETGCSARGVKCRK